MGKGIDIEDSDAFFNMRRRFWVDSRDRALAEKKPNKPSSQQSQRADKSAQNKGSEKRYVVYPHLAAARSASGS